MEREGKESVVTQRGDLLEALVRDHAGDLYRLAYRLCGHHEQAADLVQETFTESWRFIGSLRDEERARAWLVRILRNRWWHAQRAASRRPLTEPIPDVLPGPVTSRNPRADDIQDALDQLDPRLREPFLLAFMEGFRCREIATILNLPLGTVLSRIHRARQQLKAFLVNGHDVKVRPLRKGAVQ